jgi:hypothetical protein
MTRPDRRPAVHATETGALWAVAGLLAATLLLVAAIRLINTLTSLRSAPEEPTAPAIRHLVLISPLSPAKRP